MRGVTRWSHTARSLSQRLLRQDARSSGKLRLWRQDDTQCGHTQPRNSLSCNVRLTSCLLWSSWMPTPMGTLWSAWLNSPQGSFVKSNLRCGLMSFLKLGNVSVERGSRAGSVGAVLKPCLNGQRRLIWMKSKTKKIWKQLKRRIRVYVEPWKLQKKLRMDSELS